jgi:ribosomal protein S18 acetylase RimI-like enzyme
MAFIREVYILEAQRNEIKLRGRRATSRLALVKTLRYQYCMPDNNIQIRRLTQADSLIFKDIRLEALRGDPEAFGSTYQGESERPLILFSDRLRDSDMLGAFDGSDIVGIAGLIIGKGQKELHKGSLVSMYVRPQVRNRGVGRQLAEAVIDVARQRVELLQLTVVSSNESARRLYTRLGFVEYGIEKKALKQDGRYYDEVLMAKDLTLDSR